MSIAVSELLFIFVLIPNFDRYRRGTPIIFLTVYCYIISKRVNAYSFNTGMEQVVWEILVIFERYTNLIWRFLITSFISNDLFIEKYAFVFYQLWKYLDDTTYICVHRGRGGRLSVRRLIKARVSDKFLTALWLARLKLMYYDPNLCPQRENYYTQNQKWTYVQYSTCWLSIQSKLSCSKHR